MLVLMNTITNQNTILVLCWHQGMKQEMEKSGNYKTHMHTQVDIGADLLSPVQKCTLQGKSYF